MDSVYFISLGCDKNLADSEKLLWQLQQSGYTITDDEEAADVIVINTCCFIHDAKEESIQTILDMGRLRLHGRCRALIVMGCLAQRYRDEILTEIPEVDGVLGTGSMTALTDTIRRCLDGETVQDCADINRGDLQETGRVRTGIGYYSYLKIAEGCDKRCSYCIIPYIKGHYRSYPMESLIEEARKMAEGGTRELILVAQETTLYGTDLYGRRMLHELLRRLCRIDGLDWIRILYCYPEEIYDELIEVMAQEEKICHYLDLPIQHADDRVLRRMGRRTSRADLEEIVGRLRSRIPDITLRTTLITGFPGETEEAHEQLMEFVEKMRFEHLGVFTYSEEEGTPAAAMPDQVPEEVKEQRREQLMLLQQDISLEKGRSRVGTEQMCIVEGYLPEDGVYVCRTEGDAPDVDGMLFLETDRELMSGDMIRALVTDAGAYDLKGVAL